MAVSLLYKVVGVCVCLFFHCMCTLQHITLIFPVSNVSDKPGMHACINVCKCVFITVCYNHRAPAHVILVGLSAVSFSWSEVTTPFLHRFSFTEPCTMSWPVGPLNP